MKITIETDNVATSIVGPVSASDNIGVIPTVNAGAAPTGTTDVADAVMAAVGMFENAGSPALPPLDRLTGPLTGAQGESFDSKVLDGGSAPD